MGKDLDYWGQKKWRTEMDRLVGGTFEVGSAVLLVISMNLEREI